MKSLGIVLIIAGLLITIYTGFNFVVKEKVVDVGNIEISRDKKVNLNWSPLLGVVVMLVGGGMVFYGNKKA